MIKHGNMAVGVFCCLVMLGWQIDAEAEEPDYREASWHYVHWQELEPAMLTARLTDVAEHHRQHPAMLALLALEDQLENLITRAIVDFDAKENPSQATVTVEEDGFMDDDVPIVRHVVRLQRDQMGAWSITGYQRGRSTREHLGLAGHPLFSGQPEAPALEGRPEKQ